MISHVTCSHGNRRPIGLIALRSQKTGVHAIADLLTYRAGARE